MDKQRRKKLLKVFKKRPLKFIREAINNRVKKAEKRIRNEVKREVLAEVRDALVQGGGQQQQQQQSSSMRDPASSDPVVNEAIQGQEQTDFAKEAVRQGAAEKKSGGGQQFESVNQIKNQISQLQESVQSGNSPHPADQMMQQQQGGGQQQVAQQRQAAPMGGAGGGMDQGMSQLNPAAAAALGKTGGGGAPGGGMQQQPVDPQQAQSPAGAAHPQKSATTGGQQQGVQQGSQQDWPTVDGNQKMGGAVPNQPQGAGASPGGKDNVRNHNGQVPDHVRQVANRDYSELVNRFNE